jgi:ribulose-phosphate 3-epimerase
MKEPAIVASVLGADYARLGHEVAELEAADVVGACRPHAAVPFEAHLMVEDPDPWLQPFAAAGCDTVLVHAEACRHLHRTLSRIRELGVRSGVALNPATPLECVRHILDQVDVLLVMTVNPGFGGQAYLETMEIKVAEAHHLITQTGLQTLIAVDGGISAATAPRAWKAGAELLVAGSAILAHPEGRLAAVAELRRSLQPDVQAPSEERAIH